MDTRSPAKVLLLHDLFETGNAWKQSLHEYVNRLPLNGLSVTEPLEVYCADLRGHGNSNHLEVNIQDYIADSVNDIALVQHGVAGENVSGIGGIGFGALLACEYALSHPESVSSLVLFVNCMSQLSQCSSTDYTIKNTIASFQGKENSLASLNEKLTPYLPDPAARSIQLLNTFEEKEKMFFRVADTLINDSWFMNPHKRESAVFQGNTTIICPTPPTATEKSAFSQKFKQANFVQLKQPSPLSLYETEKIAPLLLHYLGMLGEITVEGS